MNWRYRDTVLVLAVVGNFSHFGSRVVISPVVPQIIATFSVSKSAVGLALTGIWGAYALLQFPSGVLGDRYGERPVILAALGLTGLGSVLLALSPSFVVFGALTLLLGAGTGLYFSVATSMLAKLYRNTGQALSLHSAGGSFAGLIMPIAGAYVGVRYGWRAAILLGPIIAVPAFVLFAWRVRPTDPTRPDEPMRSRFELRRIFALLSRPSVAYTTGIAFITTFSFQSFAAFFPTFLIEYHSFTTQQAGVAFGVIFLMSASIQPIMGKLSDRFTRDSVIAIDLLVTAVGFIVLLASSTFVVAAAAVGVLGVGMSWFGVLQARFMDIFSDAERGTGFGLVRTVFMLLGASGSVVTGTLADVLGWTAAYGLVVGLLVVAVAVLVANRALGIGL